MAIECHLRSHERIGINTDLPESILELFEYTRVIVSAVAVTRDFLDPVPELTPLVSVEIIEAVDDIRTEGGLPTLVAKDGIRRIFDHIRKEGLPDVWEDKKVFLSCVVGIAEEFSDGDKKVFPPHRENHDLVTN